MPRRRNQRYLQNDINQLNSFSSAVLRSLLALVCLDPTNPADEADSPFTTSNKRGIFSGIPATLYFSSKPLSAETEYKLSDEEYAARLSTEKTFRDERMQIEALFCATSNKIDMLETAQIDDMQLAAKQLFFVTTMGLAEACINSAIPLAALQTEEKQARADITAEFTAAESERTDIEDMFKDGLVIEKLGDDFKPITPTTSQAGLFLPVAAAASSAPTTKSWADWLLRR